jgi:gliding motility-associated-like protein
MAIRNLELKNLTDLLPSRPRAALALAVAQRWVRKQLRNGRGVLYAMFSKYPFQNTDYYRFINAPPQPHNLPAPSREGNEKRMVGLLKKYFFITVFLLLYSGRLFAQTGSLGDPVVHITFGAGTSVHAGPLPADSGITSYTYSPDDFPFDGYYTIENTTAGAGNVWWSITDHTGNAGGYMMIVNASEAKTDYFYKREVDNLCGGTTYQFSAWAGNLLRTEDLSPANITFSILDASTGVAIQSYSTGPIALQTGGFKWIQYAFDFTLPSTVSNVIIKMTNNANGGAPANDVALDDITFSPYGPALLASFSSASSVTEETECAGQTKSYTLTVPAPTGYTSPAYQWQVNTGSGWTDIAGATSLTYIANPIVQGTYEYRLASAGAANISSLSCRIVSNVLTLVVNSSSNATATANTPLCTGYTLTLSASSGTVYKWTGPNNFTSTVQSPTIANVTTANAGTYTVAVTNDNCVATDTVTVHVYAQPVADAGKDVTICIGDTTTLHAGGGLSYSWLPVTGLSDPTIADPVASPTTTTAYVVTVSNSNACTSTDTINVTVLQKPVANAGPNKIMTQGQTVTLQGTAKGTDISYYWTPDEYLSSDTVLRPTASPPADITYTLHVVSNVNCGSEATDDVSVTVYKAIVIPNTFTPNGDGINDTWDITALNTYPESLTQVFNRYGTLVYKSEGYANPWDGRVNGQVVPTGTYYYKIDLKNGNIYSGWVLVMR